MAELIAQMLASGSYDALALGCLMGLVGAALVSLLWLRLWRWFFSLMGLRA